MMSLLAHPRSHRTNSAMDFGTYDGVTTHASTAMACSVYEDAQMLPTMDRPFVCEEPGCDRRFNRKFTLTEHKKTHTGEKPYVCPLAECSRRFSTSGNLARHKRLHVSLKPFKCDINGCKRSFPSQEKLDHHIKIHTGRRTHMCRLSGCTKTFSTAGNLTRHVKNRHPELIQNSFPSCHYAQTSPEHQLRPSPHNLPIFSAEHFHVPFPDIIPAAEPLIKVEPVPPVFSPDSSIVLSSFHDELSTAFQMAGRPTSFLSRPREMDLMAEAAVGDISRCSMSVLDEVIKFELTKNI